MRLFDGAPAVTYGHLGSNDDEGHAAFIDDRFALACPVFHQYSFSPRLAETLECLERERPSVLFVTAEFEPPSREPKYSEWAEFVSKGYALLRTRYVLALSLGEEEEQVQVWTLQ